MKFFHQQYVIQFRLAISPLSETVKLT